MKKSSINFIMYLLSFMTLISYVFISIFLLLTEKYILTFNILSEFLYGNILCWFLITCLMCLLVNLMLKQNNSSDNILTIITNLLTTSTIYFFMSLFFTSPNDYGIVIQNKFFKITRIFTIEEKQEWLVRIKSLNLDERIYKLITQDHLINSKNYIEFKKKILSLNPTDNSWLDYVNSNSIKILLLAGVGIFIVYNLYTASSLNWFKFLTDEQLIHNKSLQDLSQIQLNLINKVEQHDETIKAAINFIKANVGVNSNTSKNIDILFENVKLLTADIEILKAASVILAENYRNK